MGNPMCRNLLKHGHTLKVYDVVPDLAEEARGTGLRSGDFRRRCRHAASTSSSRCCPPRPTCARSTRANSGVLASVAARHAAHRLLDHRSADVARGRDGRARRRAARWSTHRCPAAWAAPKPARSPSWSAATRRTSRRPSPCSRRMGKNIVHCGGLGQRAGGEDLQQHDARHRDDRYLRGHDARGQARHGSEGLRRRSSIPRAAAAGAPTPTTPIRACSRTCPHRATTPGGFGSDLMLKDLSRSPPMPRSPRSIPCSWGRWPSRSTRSIPSTATARRISPASSCST